MAQQRDGKGLKGRGMAMKLKVVIHEEALDERDKARKTPSALPSTN
jgi:hypothetical protein